MFRDGVVVKTVVHRVVVFIDLMKRFCSFVFFVVFSRSSIGSKISSKLYRHKLVGVVLNSLLTGLIQSSLSLCVYIRARAKEKLLLLLLKEDEEILRAKFILLLFLIPIVFCVVTASTSFSLSKRFHFHHRTERE